MPERGHQDGWGLKPLPWEGRLKSQGLFLWEKGPLRGDTVAAYKIMSGVGRVDQENFFFLSQNIRP